MPHEEGEVSVDRERTAPQLQSIDKLPLTLSPSVKRSASQRLLLQADRSRLRPGQGYEYLPQRFTSFYFTMAQITHGSYFNIAPVDIVERLFDLWLLITSLLFQSIVVSRSEHGELPPIYNGGPSVWKLHPAQEHAALPTLDTAPDCASSCWAMSR